MLMLLNPNMRSTYAVFDATHGKVPSLTSGQASSMSHAVGNEGIARQSSTSDIVCNAAEGGPS